MKVNQIPAELVRLQQQIAIEFADVEVITVHPHEPSGKGDEKPDLWMVCCEFEDGRVYFTDVYATLCRNRSYIEATIRRARRDAGVRGG